MTSAALPVMDWYFLTELTGFSPSSYPKIQSILTCLTTTQVNLTYLRTLVFTGIPEELRGLRALVWKILLNYLPPDIREWEGKLRERRENYYLLRGEFLVRRSGDSGTSSGDMNADEEIWCDIEKDIKRTRQDMHFFFLPTNPEITVESVQSGLQPSQVFIRPFASVYQEYYSELQDDNDYTRLILKNESIEKHSDVMGRILFLYAKLNPGIKYVQGMNEILAPIYYCFAQDPNPAYIKDAEADAFNCFTLLMSEVRDTFVKSLDTSDTGLQGKMQTLQEFEQRLAPKIYRKLEELKIPPHFYAMKWVMLLFTQNFELPEVLRLWDSLLADEHRFTFFFYVCIAIMYLNQEEILQGDFGETLSALQHPQNMDVEVILEVASRLQAEDFSRQA